MRSATPSELGKAIIAWGEALERSEVISALEENARHHRNEAHRSRNPNELEKARAFEAAIKMLKALR